MVFAGILCLPATRTILRQAQEPQLCIMNPHLQKHANHSLRKSRKYFIVTLIIIVVSLEKYSLKKSSE